MADTNNYSENNHEQQQQQQYIMLANCGRLHLLLQCLSSLGFSSTLLIAVRCNYYALSTAWALQPCALAQACSLW